MSHTRRARIAMLLPAAAVLAACSTSSRAMPGDRGASSGEATTSTPSGPTAAGAGPPPSQPARRSDGTSPTGPAVPRMSSPGPPPSSASSPATAPQLAQVGVTDLRPPPGAAMLPASDDCHRLVPDTSESIVSCATAATARGVLTAVVVAVSHTNFVNVYLRKGATAELVLTQGSVTSSIGTGVTDMTGML